MKVLAVYVWRNLKGIHVFDYSLELKWQNNYFLCLILYRKFLLHIFMMKFLFFVIKIHIKFKKY